MDLEPNIYTQTHNMHNKETNNHDTNIPNDDICNGTNSTFHNLADIQSSLKRIFTSKDGEKVLKYWQSSIIERPLASDTNVKQMYYMAGERNFILKLKRILSNDK